MPQTVSPCSAQINFKYWKSSKCCEYTTLLSFHIKDLQCSHNAWANSPRLELSFILQVFCYTKPNVKFFIKPIFFK